MNRESGSPRYALPWPTAHNPSHTPPLRKLEVNGDEVWTLEELVEHPDCVQEVWKVVKYAPPTASVRASSSSHDDDSMPPPPPPKKKRSTGNAKNKGESLRLGRVPTEVD